MFTCLNELITCVSIFNLVKWKTLVLYAEVGRIGIGICYDIQFQELAAIYAARGIILILSLTTDL